MNWLLVTSCIVLVSVTIVAADEPWANCSMTDPTPVISPISYSCTCGCIRDNNIMWFITESLKKCADKCAGSGILCISFEWVQYTKQCVLAVVNSQTPKIDFKKPCYLDAIANVSTYYCERHFPLSQSAHQVRGPGPMQEGAINATPSWGSSFTPIHWTTQNINATTTTTTTTKPSTSPMAPVLPFARGWQVLDGCVQMTNGSFNVTPQLDLSKCIELCSTVPGGICKSVNYNYLSETNKTCELNYEQKSDPGSDYQSPCPLNNATPGDYWWYAQRYEP